MNSGNVTDALNSITEGCISIGQAARAHGIPETTLRELVRKLKIVPKKASRGYIKAENNANLSRAIELVQKNSYTMNLASRECDVPKTTLVKAIKNFEKIKGMAPPLGMDEADERFVKKIVFKGRKCKPIVVKRLVEIHHRSAYYKKPPIKAEQFSGDAPALNIHTRFFSESPVNVENPIKKRALNVDTVYTPSPPNIHDPTSPVPSWVDDEKLSPVAGPSWADQCLSDKRELQFKYLPGSKDAMIFGSDSDARRSLSMSPTPSIPLKISSLLIFNEDSDSDGEPARRPVRLTCAERQALGQDIPIVKYCPLCTYTTSGSKLNRHLLNKHQPMLKKPFKENVSAINKKIVTESRRSYTLVPMSAVKAKMGPYWDDRCFRSVAHELTTMGRLKVYGGSWNLPGVNDYPNPFSDNIQKKKSKTMSPSSSL